MVRRNQSLGRSNCREAVNEPSWRITININNSNDATAFICLKYLRRLFISIQWLLEAGFSTDYMPYHLIIDLPMNQKFMLRGTSCMKWAALVWREYYWSDNHVQSRIENMQFIEIGMKSGWKLQNLMMEPCLALIFTIDRWGFCGGKSWRKLQALRMSKTVLSKQNPQL